MVCTHACTHSTGMYVQFVHTYTQYKNVCTTCTHVRTHSTINYVQYIAVDSHSVPSREFLVLHVFPGESEKNQF